jgi:hypothetical protein
MSSKAMRWIGHVVCMGEMRNMSILVKGMKGGDHLEVFGKYGRITLKWIVRKWV